MRKLVLFNEKNKIIENDGNFKEILLEEFIRNIFDRNNILNFQDEGVYEPLKYNAILVDIKENFNSVNWILTKNLKEIENVIGKKFVITSPITYIGRNRTAKNARYCYGLTFDIDGVEENQMIDILHQMKTGHIPTANIIVNSGNGVHLYYLFETPIALFENIKFILKNFKYHLTERLWNAYTSSIKEPQYQGIFQGFRIPQTKTKFDEDVKAYLNLNQEYWTIKELNEFVYPRYRLNDLELDILEKVKYNSKRLTKKQAKELYPEWYEKRIVKGEKRGKWNIKRDLYDWFLKKMDGGQVKEGHRYFCLMALSIYAIKCNIDYEELKRDCLNLLIPMDNLTKNEDNHFTLEDVEDALRAFKENYSTFPRKDIEKLTGIRIDANKRNGRKQEIHLKLARANQTILDEVNGTNWRVGNGRKSKQEIINNWRNENPTGRKIDCIKATGLSKATVYKWWGYK